MSPQRRSTLVGVGAAACAAAIAVATYCNLGGATLLPFALVVGALAVLGFRFGKWPAMLVCAALLGTSIGLGRFAVTGQAIDPLLADNGAVIAFHGTVQENRGLSWIVSVDQVSTSAGAGVKTISDTVLLDNVHTVSLAPGDVITATARVMRPGNAPGATSVDALARIGVDVIATASDVQIQAHSWNVARVLGVIRGAIAKSLSAALSPPYDALISGIVFGIHQTLPPETVAVLQQSGLYHIVAVSGLKVVIALAILGAIARRLEWSRRQQITISLAFLVFYVTVSGAGAAAVRSSVLAMVVLLIQRDGRRVVPLVLLALMAAGFLLAEPREALDAGFQLSYLGTAGILLWSNPIAQRLPGPGWLREPFAVTLAAQLATTPVMANTFGIVSLGAPIANTLVLPMLPAVMIGGVLLTVLSAVVPAAAGLIGIPISLAVALIIAIAKLVSSIPLEWFAVNQWPLQWLIVEAFLALAVLVWKRRGTLNLPVTRNSPPRWSWIVAGVVLATVGATSLFSYADGKLHVTVLAAGTGPAVLIRAPDGALALVDGGNSAGKLNAALGRVLSPVTHQIDLVVLTAGNTTTIAGLANLQQHYNIADAVAVNTRTLAESKTLLGFQHAGTTVVDAQGATWRWHDITWRSYQLGDGSAVLTFAGAGVSTLVLGTAGTDLQDDVQALVGNSHTSLVIAPPGGAVETTLLKALQPQYVAAPGSVTASKPGAQQIASTTKDGDLTYTAENATFTPG